MKHIISLGAGVQSSTMALMAAKGEITPMPDAGIFSDTKTEPEGVYTWLHWLEKQLPFPIHHVSLGSLADDFTTVPFFVRGETGNIGQGQRRCTEFYKVRPVNKKIRELLGLGRGERVKGHVVEQWIGISTDEAQRMKDSDKAWMKRRYPLIEKNMSRIDCLKWMDKTDTPSL